MGYIGSVVSFKDISNARCTLDGYPSLRMLDGAGHPIPTKVTDGTALSLQTDAVASKPFRGKREQNAAPNDGVSRIVCRDQETVRRRPDRTFDAHKRGAEQAGPWRRLQAFHR